MHQKIHSPIKSFSFLVLCYNHEKYIVEHLESIKFLIMSYGQNIRVQLILNDDASVDSTTYLVERWLKRNYSLFADIKILFNDKNIGTCSSLYNMLSCMNSDFCKITAGDDVYSFENIFSLSKFLSTYDMVSGIPLNLNNGLLSAKWLDILNIVATYFIYSKRFLSERFSGIGLTNTPNIFYKTGYLKNDKVLNFFSDFDVVEDWPLQFAIANLNEHAVFYQAKKVYVYYRRTSGSTYLVESSRFYNDQKRMFEHLAMNEKSKIKRLLTQNRLFCFQIKSKFFKKILNISLYIYFLNVLGNVFRVYRLARSLEIDLNKHRAHYGMIKLNANEFLRLLNQNEGHINI